MALKRVRLDEDDEVDVTYYNTSEIECKKQTYLCCREHFTSPKIACMEKDVFSFYFRFLLCS